jgi:hypothetical protein
LKVCSKVEKAIAALTNKATEAVCQEVVRILRRSSRANDILSRVGRRALGCMN